MKKHENKVNDKLEKILTINVIKNVEKIVWQKFITAFRTINSPFREILKLNFAGRSKKEIATLLGISTNEASVLITKARNELIAKLHKSTRVKQ